MSLAGAAHSLPAPINSVRRQECLIVVSSGYNSPREFEMEGATDSIRGNAYNLFITLHYVFKSVSFRRPIAPTARELRTDEEPPEAEAKSTDKRRGRTSGRGRTRTRAIGTDIAASSGRRKKPEKAAGAM